jgi:sugar phosphate isomerase/epimerase
MLRRTFLQTGAAAAMPLSAGEFIALGYDTYSIRDFRWKAFELIDYAAKLKLDTLQISSFGEYESLEPAYLAKVKEHAGRLGIAIDAGIGCICPTSSAWSPRYGTPEEYILKGLKVARAVGAPSMRCFVGSAAERRANGPVAKHVEATLKVLRSVRQQAQDTGVKIAIENHNGDLRARELRTLVEEAGKDFVGVCLDAGNPIWLMEDPQFTLEILGPYVTTTHVRDTALYEHPRGAAFQWVALGDGCIDLAAWLAGVRKVAPKAALQLEIITGRPPQVLPYLEPGYWSAFPDFPAADFARFLALVKKGHPFTGPMMVAGAGKQPPEYAAALKQQQMVDLERSLEYAKKTLGAGHRWRTPAG